MRPSLKIFTFAALLTGFGHVASAQPVTPVPGRAIMPRAGGVTAILNARRALELTPRQVAQLDSIERGLHAERPRMTDAPRSQMPPMQRMQQWRARDSVAMAAAERLLTDAQRGTWREMQAERRGFVRGMRAGRGGGRGQQFQGPRGQGREGMARRGLARPGMARPGMGRPAPDA